MLQHSWLFGKNCLKKINTLTHCLDGSILFLTSLSFVAIQSFALGLIVNTLTKVYQYILTNQHTTITYLDLFSKQDDLLSLFGSPQQKKNSFNKRDGLLFLPILTKPRKIQVNFYLSLAIVRYIIFKGRLQQR